MSKVNITKLGISTYLTPAGPFNDDQGREALIQAMEECLASHQFNLVIDLDKVPTLNGAALEVLLDVQRRLADRSGGLRVVNANALIRDIFLATDIADLINIVTARNGNGK